MSDVYVGIDNGISGALSVVTKRDGLYVWSAKMPSTKRGRSNEVDVIALKELLYGFAMDDSATIILEAPTKHAKGKLSLCSTHECFGVVRSVVAMLELRMHIITNPKTWQQEFWNTSAGYDTKVEALRVAKLLWPKEKFMRTPRCTTPDGGFVDAALIAEYGRRKGL